MHMYDNVMQFEYDIMIRIALNQNQQERRKNGQRKRKGPTLHTFLHEYLIIFSFMRIFFSGTLQ